MIDTSFLRLLDRFHLIISKRVTSSFSGAQQSHFSGGGLLFKDHSIYSPGSDFRSIDWKVFARTDKLFIKRFEEERNLTVHIIVDYSASMNFGDKIKKSDYAAMVGLGYAYMALRNNERFVLSTFTDKLDLFKPKKGKKQLAAIFSYLNEKRPEGKTNLEEALSKYKSLIDSKSVIVIISDFLYEIQQITNVLFKLKGHDIRLIQVLDKMEEELPIEGDFKLKDAETQGTMRAFISAFTRKKYTMKLEEHKARAKKECDKAGARFYSYKTNTPIFDSFYEMFNVR